MIAAIVVTARNVTFALNGAPESSEAYESGGQILSVIQDSESSQLSQTGDKKLVLLSSHNSYCVTRITNIRIEAM